MTLPPATVDEIEARLGFFADLDPVARDVLVLSSWSYSVSCRFADGELSECAALEIALRLAATIEDVARGIDRASPHVRTAVERELSLVRREARYLLHGKSPTMRVERFSRQLERISR